MLQLQRKLIELRSKTLFLVKLLSLSAAIHAMLLLLLFFVHERVERLTIIADRALNAPIMIMPLVKQMPNMSAQILKHSQGAASQPINILAPAPKKSSTVIKPLAQPLKNLTKKDEPKKNAATKDAKKENVKKVAAVEKKNEIKKEEPKNNEPPKQPEPQKIPITNQALPELIPTSTIIAQDAAPAAPEPLMVGAYDFDMLILSEEIKEGIEAAWVRPAGLSSATAYEAVIKVSKPGKATIIQEKSSGALALDIAARNFINQYEFPAKIWGREITIIL